MARKTTVYRRIFARLFNQRKPIFVVVRMDLNRCNSVIRLGVHNVDVAQKNTKR